MDAADTSQHRTFQRRDPRSSPDRLGTDARRRPDRIHQGLPTGKPRPPCESVSVSPRSIGLFIYQSIDVAKGLHYLHYYDVIHGDLKGVGFTLSSNFQVSFIETL